MTLRLSIENVDRLSDGGPLRIEVKGRGLDLGRDAHLDWTLPDPSRSISSKHCEIRYRDGGYWLHDISTNGTFVNGAQYRLDAPYMLARRRPVEHRALHDCGVGRRAAGGGAERRRRCRPVGPAGRRARRCVEPGRRCGGARGSRRLPAAETAGGAAGLSRFRRLSRAGEAGAGRPFAPASMTGSAVPAAPRQPAAIGAGYALAAPARARRDRRTMRPRTRRLAILPAPAQAPAAVG